MPFHRFRSLFAFAVAAAAGALPVAAAADVAPPASLVSNYETASGNVLQRDCGFSHQLPGNSSLAVWLFCDTPIASSGGTVIGFIPGSSAAVGPFTPGRVPTDLSEIPTPPAPIESLPSAQAPQRFLPTPDGLVLPDGTTRCGASGSNSYAATWMSGVNREPSSANRSLLLISFTDVCVSGGSAITTERFGIAEYNPATNTVTAMTRVFATASPGQDLGTTAPQLLLGSPVFSGSFLYLFSARCSSAGFGACGAGSVYLARTPANPTSWRQSSTYQFFDPGASGGWTRDPASAQSVISGAQPFAVTADSFSSVGQGLDLVEETSLGGNFRVWTASSPPGPWTQKTSGQVPCTSGSGALNFCRALIGHPELSTSSQLLLSFYDPGTDHVRIASTPW
ncbi:MAG: hypothetical protein E6J41_02235 [Chloroflexi bacterium]|nr:MAG: hypothetical protein E6J41_02235 [Chloroflexota bacterium]